MNFIIITQTIEIKLERLISSNEQYLYLILNMKTKKLHDQDEKKRILPFIIYILNKLNLRKRICKIYYIENTRTRRSNNVICYKF